MKSVTPPKRYTVTAALPYANGLKHLGHAAGVYLPADIYVRYLRSQQRDVIFVCGSDENGAAITLQAIKEKKKPQEIVDYYHTILKKNLDTLGISFDKYHRTSSKLHHQTAQEFFLHLYEKGHLNLQEEKQFFDRSANVFLADRYIKGTCPVCENENAYGDQCESCGSALSPQDLINPKSTISNEVPVLKKTKHFYLPLENHTSFIENWMNDNQKKGWKTNVIGQCKSWINQGLKSRAVTRDLDWGVKVPLDELSNKVLYVWFDAPIGYISATKQWAKEHQVDWQPYWQDKDTKLVHFIGKDNIVFHCIIFPIMLQLRGYILPENVPANEFMNLEGDKMSTSRGWNIPIDTYIKDFVAEKENGKERIDCLRYYLTSIMPETKDSEFVWKKYQETINSELVSILGNYINRTWILTHKLAQGRVPPIHSEDLNEIDKAFIEKIETTPRQVAQLIENYHFREALQQAMGLARKANKYLQDKAPWQDAQKNESKQIQHKTENTLHICLQASANLAILLSPFLPNIAATLQKMLTEHQLTLDWKNAGKITLLKTGKAIASPKLLISPIEGETVTKALQKIKDIQKSMKPVTQSNIEKSTEITIDQFNAIDLRAGTIIDAEKVENTDKLLKLTVSLGNESRIIVSGIAHQFEPTLLNGKRVVVVTNLAKKKIKGVPSHGMLLLSESKQGMLSFVQPGSDSEDGAPCK